MYIQINTDIYKYIQVYTGIYKYIQIYTGIYMYSRSGLGKNGMRREFKHSSPSRTEGQETVEVYLNSPIRLQGVALLGTHSFTCYRKLLTSSSCSLNSLWVHPARILHGSTAPSGSGPPHCLGFKITLRHTTLGTSDQSYAETSICQHIVGILARYRHPCPR